MCLRTLELPTVGTLGHMQLHNCVLFVGQSLTGEEANETEKARALCKFFNVVLCVQNRINRRIISSSDKLS